MTPDRPPAAARRGRRPASEDTRSLIVEAARAEFADKGYDGTALRAVARNAGVDAALIHHYFDGKADLFAQAVVLTRVDPRIVIAGVLDGPLETLGDRIVRTFLAVWDDPDNGERLVAMLRAAQTNEDVAAVMRRVLVQDIVGQVTRRTGVSDAHLRGGMAATQLVGMATSRYLLRLSPVVDASHDDLARWIGPTLQRYLVDPA
ncbi:MAG: TetR family transcriptional regulator [Actinomycetota bacterium]|nr:TetR family transcriptional regulator [Actinomycetota bacterium]